MLVSGNLYFVTGASSGLGLGTAKMLIAKGAYVMMLDMNEEAGLREAKLLGQKAAFVLCDVRDEQAVIAAISYSDACFPGILIGGVVHCGGIGMAGTTLNSNGDPFSIDAFRETIDINLTGSFIIAAYIASRISKQYPKPIRTNPVQEDRGVIILVSSVSFEEGQQGQAAYGSSKAGVVGLCLPIARDLARYGIRCQAIAPSLFSTAMGANTSPKVKAGLLESTLNGRFGEAEEFAHLSIAIIENPMLNGNVIRLDGGSRMSKM